MNYNDFKACILFENEDFFAVNKPAFVSSLHDRVSKHNILDLAKAYHQDSQLCHRIDKETSGILLIAKNKETYRSFSILFEKREIQKEYLAIVHGKHFFENEQIDLAISTTSRGKSRIGGKAAKNAETIVNTVEQFQNFSLVSCKPITGRLHQIRVHLKAYRATIIADSIYGDGPPYLSDIKRNFRLGKDKEPKPIINRTALHAHKIKFNLGAKKYNLEAPLPKDISIVVKLLKKYN